MDTITYFNCPNCNASLQLESDVTSVPGVSQPAPAPVVPTPVPTDPQTAAAATDTIPADTTVNAATPEPSTN